MSRVTKLMCCRFAVTCNWRFDTCRGRDSVVGMVTRWRNGRSGVRIPARKRGFFSMPKPPNRALSKVEAAGAWSWPLTIIHCRGCEWMELYLCYNYMPSCSGQEEKRFFLPFLHQCLGSHVPTGCTENLTRGIKLKIRCLNDSLF